MARVPANVLDPNLYEQVKEEARNKFDVYPSIYANAWVVREYKARGGQYGDKKPTQGLTKWFDEKWVDLARPVYDANGNVVGFADCGRPKASAQADTRDYPKCRPLATAMAMTPAERADAISRKRQAEARAPKRKGRAPIMVPTFKDKPMFKVKRANAGQPIPSRPKSEIERRVDLLPMRLAEIQKELPEIAGDGDFFLNDPQGDHLFASGYAGYARAQMERKFAAKNIVLTDAEREDQLRHSYRTAIHSMFAPMKWQQHKSHIYYIENDLAEAIANSKTASDTFDIAAKLPFPYIYVQLPRSLQTVESLLSIDGEHLRKLFRHADYSKLKVDGILLTTDTYTRVKQPAISVYALGTTGPTSSVPGYNETCIKTHFVENAPLYEKTSIFSWGEKADVFDDYMKKLSGFVYNLLYIMQKAPGYLRFTKYGSDAAVPVITSGLRRKERRAAEREAGKTKTVKSFTEIRLSPKAIKERQEQAAEDVQADDSTPMTRRAAHFVSGHFHKYWVRNLPPETKVLDEKRDENGRLWHLIVKWILPYKKGAGEVVVKPRLMIDATRPPRDNYDYAGDMHMARNRRNAHFIGVPTADDSGEMVMHLGEGAHAHGDNRGFVEKFYAELERLYPGDMEVPLPPLANIHPKHSMLEQARIAIDYAAESFFVTAMRAALDPNYKSEINVRKMSSDELDYFFDNADTKLTALAGSPAATAQQQNLSMVAHGISSACGQYSVAAQRGGNPMFTEGVGKHIADVVYAVATVVAHIDGTFIGKQHGISLKKFWRDVGEMLHAL